MTSEQAAKLEEMIKKEAAKKARSDNEEFMINDYAGGNIDDAYYMGGEDGTIWFARQLLAVLEGKK